MNVIRSNSVIFPLQAGASLGSAVTETLGGSLALAVRTSLSSIITRGCSACTDKDAQSKQLAAVMNVSHPGPGKLISEEWLRATGGDV